MRYVGVAVRAVLVIVGILALLWCWGQMYEMVWRRQARIMMDEMRKADTQPPENGGK